MSASLFDNKPERCPFGHQLWPGRCLVSWTPCICGPAQEANERGRGLGHGTILCRQCEREHRSTTYFEPPHDTGRKPLAGWLTSPLTEPVWGTFVKDAPLASSAGLPVAAPVGGPGSRGHIPSATGRGALCRGGPARRVGAP